MKTPRSPSLGEKVAGAVWRATCLRSPCSFLRSGCCRLHKPGRQPAVTRTADRESVSGQESSRPTSNDHGPLPAPSRASHDAQSARGLVRGGTDGRDTRRPLPYPYAHGAGSTESCVSVPDQPSGGRQDHGDKRCDQQPDTHTAAGERLVGRPGRLLHRRLNDGRGS